MRQGGRHHHPQDVRRLRHLLQRQNLRPYQRQRLLRQAHRGRTPDAALRGDAPTLRGRQALFLYRGGGRPRIPDRFGQGHLHRAPRAETQDESEKGEVKPVDLLLFSKLHGS